MSPRPVKMLAIALLSLVCCAATSPTCNSNEQIGPSTGQVVAGGVVIIAVVAAVIIIPIEVSKSHHTLKGCIVSTPAGLELRTSENKTFALSGTTADIVPGRTLRLHGKRQKHDKSAAGDQVFIVQKMQKNYGPCQALVNGPNSPAPQP